MAADAAQQNLRNTLYGGVVPRVKYLVASYPTVVLLVLFAVPMTMLFVFSFYRNISGGYFEPAFTFENYVRFLTESLYVDRAIYTLRLSAVTAVISLVMGYPLAYYIVRVKNGLVRRLYLTVTVSTLWLTFIIRGYAWSTLLQEGGPVPRIAAALGLMAEPSGLVPGYWALVVSMVYVFLPFMVLTLYTSLRNIDRELLEASKNLGAGPLTTFRRVTLPLSASGIASGTMLVFVLSLGVYVLPRLLGSPPQWTLAVLIGNQVMLESNIPFAAALSIGLLIVVVILAVVGIRVAGIDPESYGGGIT
ncbi:ABC transporter permease [Halobellus sp. EA9]|uniref:ABC transporter permease n=1 Tax=Halobellus sp. EA9 TaxID=3421647 RepID=UPI003EC06B71